MRISDLIEDPRNAEDYAADLKEAAEEPWKARPVVDATCHTEVMYQLAEKLQLMLQDFLNGADSERRRAMHKDEEFVMVAHWLAGVDGFALTSSLVNAINQVAIAIDYDYWLDEHKQPAPDPIPN